MSESATLTAARVPTVYFIDDSATMREVMKIAFRKENVQVITCPDAASALAQFSEAAPDAVITDVIMPDKDGYEVCDFIKQHEQFAKTPVILMSGVVNKTVAEKAMSVKADELIRKPFHPQDLIGRVKGLLAAKIPSAAVGSPAPSALGSPAAPSSAKVLTSFFAPPPIAPQASPVAEPRPAMPVPAGAMRSAIPSSYAPSPNMAVQRPSATAPTAVTAEAQKLRNEIRRLELLVKKLQAELEAEHEYCRSLEAHVKTLQE
jgi:CheY-like chemotaxis protein